MRKSKEEAQDNALHHMEKLLRNNKTPEKREKSLAEQLKDLDDYNALSPSEKLKRMDWSDWTRALEKFIIDDKRKCSTYRFRGFMSKDRKRFEEWHSKGTLFTEILRWIEDQPDYY